MATYPIPENESERVAALHAYGILETPREIAYDELSELAAQICGCPIAFVSFIDTTKQWMKATCGLPPDLVAVPREVSVCNSTICQSDVLVVPDLAADDRFRDLPVVKNPPNFRFYCGAPLITRQGHALGSICVMDFQPRQLAFEQVESIRRLSHQVMAHLDLLRTVADLNRVVAEADQARRAAEAAGRRADELLLNILPASVAAELKDKQAVEARYYESVTIGFTDFRGFTRLASSLEPARLVHTLDDFFTLYDDIVRRRGLEKLKTIGDAYMFAGGLPQPNRSHPVDACLAALELLAATGRMNRQREKLRLPPWEVRIGLHTGPAMAGVVGRWKFAYDLWGDSANIAARMEQAGEAGRVNVSEATRHRVKDLFEFEERGAIEAKNRGALPMFFLDRIKPELAADAEGRTPSGKFHDVARRLFADYRAPGEAPRPAAR